jgi:hypothetical protein
MWAGGSFEAAAWREAVRGGDGPGTDLERHLALRGAAVAAPRVVLAVRPVAMSWRCDMGMDRDMWGARSQTRRSDWEADDHAP